MSYRYCCNHDVLCGKYDCNMADVVNNSVMCESKECMYNGGDYAKKHLIGETDREQYFKLHSGSVYGNTVYRIILGEDIRYLSDDEFPF